MYLRFGLMIATSTLVMFALTYTNAYSADHVRFSEERLYMALLMGAAMALIMLAFMWGMMYRNRVVNVDIIIGRHRARRNCAVPVPLSGPGG